MSNETINIINLNPVTFGVKSNSDKIDPLCEKMIAPVNNQYLDNYLEKGKFGFEKQFFFKKDQKFTTWKEVNNMDIGTAKYEEKFPPHAKELIFAIFTKNS